MRPRSYVGITGFTKRSEIRKAVVPFLREHDQLVMLGVLVSSKTIDGQINKWPRRYPRTEELDGIFMQHANMLNLIHFNTGRPGSLLDDLLLAQKFAGALCHGFQLNMAWPDKRVLEAYKKVAAAPFDKIVLQCGGKALNAANNDPKQIADKAREYEGLAEYVLIDPSGGYGKEFDIEFASRCFEALETLPNSMGYGIAGGLNADNVSRLSALRGRFDFSIDAEGRLRDMNDDLDIEAAKRYLYRSSSVHTT